MKPQRKINKILLTQPRYTIHKNDVRRCTAPMGLAYLAAYLEKDNYKVKIIDVPVEGYYNVKEQGDFVTFGLSNEEIKKKILDFNPDIVGVSCLFSTQSDNTKKYLQFIKAINSNIITLTGGCHPTFALEDMLDYADFVISGEGELPTSQLINALNSGQDVSKIGGVSFRENGRAVTNPNLQYIEDLDELPFPARHLLDMEMYFRINSPHNPYPNGKRVAQIITSRGCTAKCVFCSTTNFWGNCYRGRTAENVITEIKQLKEKYNIDEVQFSDDNLTANKKRAMRIMDKLQELNLMWCAPNGVAIWTLDPELLEKAAQSGCYQLTFAVESGNQYVLNKIVKKPLKLSRVKPLVQKAQELGIHVHSFAVCGFPGETLEQMQDTYNFIEDCGFNSASFFVANPLLGSELYDICREKGYLREDLQQRELLFKRGNITTPEFKAEEVQELVEHFNRAYNDNPNNKRFGKQKY